MTLLFAFASLIALNTALPAVHMPSPVGHPPASSLDANTPVVIREGDNLLLKTQDSELHIVIHGKTLMSWYDANPSTSTPTKNVYLWKGADNRPYVCYEIATVTCKAIRW